MQTTIQCMRYRKIKRPILRGHECDGYFVTLSIALRPEVHISRNEIECQDRLFDRLAGRFSPLAGIVNEIASLNSQYDRAGLRLPDDNRRAAISSRFIALSFTDLIVAPRDMNQRGSLSSPPRSDRRE